MTDRASQPATLRRVVDEAVMCFLGQNSPPCAGDAPPEAVISLRGQLNARQGNVVRRDALIPAHRKSLSRVRGEGSGSGSLGNEHYLQADERGHAYSPPHGAVKSASLTRPGLFTKNVTLAPEQWQVILIVLWTRNRYMDTVESHGFS